MVIAAAEPSAIERAICGRIRSSVSAGDLPPGTKLPEEFVAEAFSTSRSHVRAAFQQLAFEGLVELQRNRGAFIARPTIKEARDVFEARRVIERVTTEIVTRTILTHQLGALTGQMRAQTPHWMRANRQMAISGTSSFHLALAALAHNTALTTAVERLIIRTSLILGLYGTARSFAALPEAYADLMDLMTAGQSLAASRQMERCLDAIERGLDFFPPARQDVDLKRLLRTVG